MLTAHGRLKRVDGRVWTLTCEAGEDGSRYWAITDDKGNTASLEAFEGPQRVVAWAWQKAGYPA